MWKKFTPALWGATLLVGFASSAHAQTPPTVAPSVANSGSAPIISDVDSRELTLEEAIQVAFANHGDVSAAELAALSAGQRINSARSALAPQVNVTVGSNLGQGTIITQNTTPGTGTGTNPGTGTGTTTTSTSYITSTQTNFGLSQMVYDGGRLRSTIKQAQANSTSARAGLGVARQSLAYTVASNFYEQLRQERLLSQRTQPVALAQGQLAQIEAQIAEGTAARVDAQSVRVTLSQARFDQTTARNALNAAQTNLRNALGLPRGPVLRLREGADVTALSASFAPLTPEQVSTALTVPPADTTTDTEAIEPTVPDATTPETDTEVEVEPTPTATPVPLNVPALAPLSQYIETAQQQRPDLQQSRAAILTGEASLAIAKAARLPQVGATAGYNLQNIYNSGRGFTAGLSLSLPLFDAGGRRSDVKAAQTDLEASRTRLTQLEKDVAAEVQTAYVNVSGAVERISNAQALVESARQNLEAATEKYRAGVGIVLDVVNAQTQFAQAQTSATTAIYDYEIALADLTRSTGVLASGSTQTTPIVVPQGTNPAPSTTDNTSLTPTAPATP